MKDNKEPDQHKLEKTTAMSGELVNVERATLVKMPMKGKVQFPYNHPYDRSAVSEVLHDQTDRAAIARYTYKDVDVYIQKKLSGREYSWNILDANGNRKYGNVYIDRENLGDEAAIGFLVPEIEDAIDFLQA